MNSIFQMITELANQPVWLAGGAVRELLSGRTPVDFDLATAGSGLALAKTIAAAAGGTFVALDQEHDTGRAVLPGGITIDCATLRAKDLTGDLRLRDFTINALALPLPAVLANDWNAIIDPLGGRDDLAAGRLRLCAPTSLRDDPLRVVRAGRFRATHRLQPTPDLITAARAAAPFLTHVAIERIRDELLKLCDGPAAAAGLRLLDEAGALTTIFPELEPARACDQPRVHFLPVLAHMIETVAALDWLIDDGDPPVAAQTHPQLSRALPFAQQYHELLSQRRGIVRRAALLKLAALLHDNAKPYTKVSHPDGTVTFYGHQSLGAETVAQIGRRLRLSRADTGYLVSVVREHMRPGQMRDSEQLSERGINRFFRDTGDAGPDILLHELADHLATRGPWLNPEAWQQHLAWLGAILERYWNPPAPPAPPLIRGDELMAALQIGPGPEVGRLLKLIHEAQLAGDIHNAEEALALARALRVAER
ncbi:HD domain-containing protein [Chloroflexus sp.]|uniref:HD domain-containing protein n=1 Tax=Chloroflexus sp. TaxID=1904827 RepID=UPI00298EF6C2|nr:HD domain-containing protein [Chloroflexus sp.]MDW8403732.1 HD domain-containing protein [Chloroflexus sp.]